MTADERFLEAFEALRLPLSQWHHRDHVRLAYLYLCRYPFEEAVQRTRSGIRAHNGAHGLVDSPTGGYHETITQAWLHLVGSLLERHGPAASAEAFCAAHPGLLRQDTLEQFYSPQLLHSPQAKACFCPPDRAPLPSVGGAARTPGGS
ncbi:MAG: hypothetical protein ACOVNL_13915 [Prochlorococcaceae cyanobacterium]|jgi:hypothetical protein